jgi:hypothetical protein
MPWSYVTSNLCISTDYNHVVQVCLRPQRYVLTWSTRRDRQSNGRAVARSWRKAAIFVVAVFFNQFSYALQLLGVIVKSCLPDVYSTRKWAHLFTTQRWRPQRYIILLRFRGLRCTNRANQTTVWISSLLMCVMYSIYTLCMEHQPNNNDATSAANTYCMFFQIIQSCVHAVWVFEWMY